MDNRAYYDAFAPSYERERARGYHRLVDDLELGLIRRYGSGRRILEAGCGSGLLLARARRFAAAATGVDLSAAMLSLARARGLDVAQGTVTALPYPDACFDLVYSVKVLAHVAAIRDALRELARVTVPGGHVLAEFYNPYSLRALVKRLTPPARVSPRARDTDVYTRYDSPHAIRAYLPRGLRWHTTRGVRIITPAAIVHRLPCVGGGMRAAERWLADVPGVRRLGGFLIAVLRKES